MVIFCSGGHTFPIHNLISESELIYNLLQFVVVAIAVYNIFDSPV